MNRVTKNTEFKEALETLGIYEEVWISSLQSNLLKLSPNQFLLSLYNVKTDTHISHTVITLPTMY